MVRACLGDAGGHCAHTQLGSELHGDARVRVRVLEIVNQLRNVLDGVDVVVRRRADESHPGGGIANGGDHLVHLEPGQLAPFARLCPLHDLDLQLVGICEVIYGHPEATARYLFDGRARGVTVLERDEAPGVLTALARVGFAADAIHRNGEGLMRFDGYGAEAHGPRGETLHYFALRLDFFEWNRSTIDARLEAQQPSEGRMARRNLVSVVSKLPIGIFAVGARGHL